MQCFPLKMQPVTRLIPSPPIQVDNPESTYPLPMQHLLPDIPYHDTNFPSENFSHQKVLNCPEDCLWDIFLAEIDPVEIVSGELSKENSGREASRESCMETNATTSHVIYTQMWMLHAIITSKSQVHGIAGHLRPFTHNTVYGHSSFQKNSDQFS